MSRAFVDTSYYIAIFNPADGLHKVARLAQRSTARRLVTTQFVIVELGNHLSAGDRAVFGQFLRIVSEDPDTDIVPASAEWFEKGTRLYIERPDKDWSLTDCISFAVMEELGINDALTYDHHFEQAGFRALLRE